MKVTVSIVAFQQVDTIAEAVESALSQRIDYPFEVIVGDDGSTDGTADVLREIAARDDRVRLRLAAENGGDDGLSNLRATIEAARGKYVAFLDGDDYWTAPDKLARQIALLDQYADCDICAHRVRHLEDDGAVRLSPSPARGVSRQDVGILLSTNFCPKIATVVRRSALAELPDWYWTPDVVSKDWQLNVLAARRGGVLFLDKVMATHRIHSTSISWVRGSERMLSDKLMALDLLERHVDGRSLAFARARRKLRLKRRLAQLSPGGFAMLKTLHARAALGRAVRDNG